MAASDIDALARHFAAAGHPVRLRILSELSSRGRRPAELAELLLVTPDSVREHLRVLREDGLVDRGDGGEYRVTREVEMLQRAAPTVFPETFDPEDLE